MEERSAIGTLLKGLTGGGEIIQDGEQIIGQLLGGSSGSSDTTTSNPTTKRDDSIEYVVLPATGQVRVSLTDEPF